MIPIRFTPILKRARWGGRALGELLGKPIGAELDYAESWEIADHADGQSLDADGGAALSSLVADSPNELFGQHAGLDQFPLLIKFLDANDWLSLQVHPNDQQAKSFNPTENGKTEAWGIVDAKPGAKICAGLKAGVDRSAFAAHLENGTVEECLNIFEVKVGDCIFIPAGTVHAIGEGIVLAEVQQQSNLTFRLHDWGRMGTDGKPREIHVAESLKVTDFERGPVSPVTPDVIARTDEQIHEELVRGDYFVIQRHTGAGNFAIEADNRFHILMCLQGSARVMCSGDDFELSKGATTLIPAAATDVEVCPVGNAAIMDVFLP